MKGKWFHFPTVQEKKTGKGQSALYLPFRLPLGGGEAGARCSERRADGGRASPEPTPLNSPFMERPSLYDRRVQREAAGVSPLTARQSAAVRTLPNSNSRPY